jgi:TRAP-type C4-dicarboxylate transport system substrate-binding protein
MAGRIGRVLVALSVLLAGPVWAEHEPVMLRMASVAPEGTSWVREFRAFSREVEVGTDEEVRIKWYLSGVAGDEPESIRRIERDQLDGAVGSAKLCMGLAPSMRVLTVAGLFRDSDEAIYVLNHMKTLLDNEFLQAGFVNLADAGMGFHIVLSRVPINSLGDLKKNRLWVWDLDQVLVDQLSTFVHVVPLPVEQAARAYDEKQIDGFVSIPTAALAFQWSTQARYVSALRVSFLPGCMLVKTHVFDQLSFETQQKLRAAAAKLQLRIEDAARLQDERLLGGGLFAKQGLKEVPVSEQFRFEFDQAAREAQVVTEQRLPSGARLEVKQLLAEYRRRRSGR